MASGSADTVDAGAAEVDVRDVEARRLHRRQVIKAAGVAGVAAWTAPVIIDSLVSPAAAISGCPAGKLAYVVLWSPQGPGGGNGLTDRPGGDGAATMSPGSCAQTEPGTNCQNHDGTRVLTLAENIGLTHSVTNISHDINNLSQATVTITLDAASCCKITNVRAHVHRYATPTGNSTSGDCPPIYCQPATTNGQYLQLVTQAGTGYGTKQVIVRPNTADNACMVPAGTGSDEVHWGSPNTNPSCQSSAGFGYTNGQPLGYMIIDLDCTGT